MHRLVPLLLAALLAGPAAAQPLADVYSGPGTLLRLTETADVTRAPDELRATLRVEARDATAAAAGAAANRAMGAALEAARAVPSVVASTGAYRTWRDPQTGRWTAIGALDLRGTDAGALLDLAGTLQARGMALDGMTYALTRDAARAARQEAASLALDAARRRAEAVAGGMGMRVDRIAEVRIGGDAPRAMPMRAEMARAAAAGPPVAQADDVVITAAVEAFVILSTP